MSASGSTPHLHLSQYDAGDRPSYVSDYTEDMGRIDTGFNLAQTNALTALNRVAALEQSIGSAGAVGQTAQFTAGTTVNATSGGEKISIVFGGPEDTATRNADPADVPWTWRPAGDAVDLVFAGPGAYRVTVEAAVEYPSSLDISSAYISLFTDTDHVAPLFPCGHGSGFRRYCGSGSFVMPYGDEEFPDCIRIITIFNESAVSGGQVQCELTVDVEQLSAEDSKQSFPGQPDGQ